MLGSRYIFYDFLLVLIYPVDVASQFVTLYLSWFRHLFKMLSKLQGARGGQVRNVYFDFWLCAKSKSDVICRLRFALNPALLFCIYLTLVHMHTLRFSLSSFLSYFFSFLFLCFSSSSTRCLRHNGTVACTLRSRHSQMPAVMHRSLTKSSW